MRKHPAGKRFTRILRLLPAVFCLFFCSCASTMTWKSLGHETFIWNPSELGISVKTELGKDFLEKRTVSVVKKGESLRYYVPYDFAGIFPVRDVSVRTEEYAIAGNLPLIPVREVPGTKNLSVFTDDAPLPQFTDADLNCAFAGSPESVKASSVSPEDFARLKKPFMFRHFGEWFLCVPGDAMDGGDMFLIPAAKFGIGLGPDILRADRRQETHLQGAGITLWRILWLPLPLVFDIVTFPVQLLILVTLH